MSMRRTQPTHSNTERPPLRRLPGVVWRASEGRWMARLQVGGNRHAEYGRTEEEARAAWLAWYYGAPRTTRSRASRTFARSGSERPATVKELFACWLDERVKPYLAVRTYETYRDIVRLHLEPEFGTLTLDQLDSDRIQLYFNRLVAAETPTTTIARHRTTLGSCLRWAVKPKRWLPAIPMDGVVTPPSHAGVRARHSYDEAPSSAWIPNADDVAAFLTANRDSFFWPMWYTAFTLGLRPGELCALGEDELRRDEEGRVRIVAITRQAFRGRERDEHGQRPWVVTQPKGGSSRTLRDAPTGVMRVLLDAAIRARDAWDPTRDPRWRGWLWLHPDTGEPWDPTSLSSYAWPAARKAAGGVWVTEAPCLYDATRHFCASALLQRGYGLRDVADWLGQKWLASLESTYSHVLRARVGQQSRGEVLDELLPLEVVSGVVS